MTDPLRLTQSQSYHDRATCIPGRSLTRSKAPGKLFNVCAGPLYVDSGSGPFLIDVDGNRFIDMICALGAISLGYGGVWADNPDATQEVRRGWIYSLPSSLEVRAAEAALRTIAPWASSIRFVKTGSEATHAAYRIAKRVTGRKLVLVGDWAYHGWHEWSDKVDSETAHFYAHGEDMDHWHGLVDWMPAAVFIEPHRWEPVDVAWLRSVRAFCDRVGALLVFDEMIYGGRWANGGATEYFGVTPDLACFGKAIGNGAPIACVVGNAALQEHGEIVSGTYSGDAAALASMVATLEVYHYQPVIETLWKRGKQLARGLREALPLYHGEVMLEGAPVHQRLRFGEVSEGRRFAGLMAQRGVLWHPDVVNVSYAHTEAVIERVVEAAMTSLGEMAQSQQASVA